MALANGAPEESADPVVFRAFLADSHPVVGELVFDTECPSGIALDNMLDLRA